MPNPTPDFVIARFEFAKTYESKRNCLTLTHFLAGITAYERCFGNLESLGYLDGQLEYFRIAGPEDAFAVADVFQDLYHNHLWHIATISPLNPSFVYQRSCINGEAKEISFKKAFYDKVTTGHKLIYLAMK